MHHSSQKIASFFHVFQKNFASAIRGTERLPTVFLVSCSRGRQALKELIGESFEGILHSDRWGAYNMVDPLR
ncbi:MAG: transposase, partial [Chloroflexi bacterium]|nr:transposase [Chloroflexota bacterium]